jgi:hypothetical protein
VARITTIAAARITAPTASRVDLGLRTDVMAAI